MNAETLPITVPRLEPPHKQRAGWDRSCGYCDAAPGDPCRTKSGRPYVLDPDGNSVTYTRVSTMAKAVDDGTNLTKWKQRTTAVGLLRRPGLMTRMSGVLAKASVDDAKRDLDRICEEAFEAGGGSDKASAGTGFHDITEAMDQGAPIPEWVTGADRERLEAYREAMAPFTPVRAEGFVVNDELRAAGSYDRLWLCSDGRVRVGDLKSGRWDADYPLGVTTQEAIYARSLHYDHTTGVRTILDERLDPDTGLLIHMPPSGGCTVIPLDLRKGWAVAQAAKAVRDIRTWKAEDFRAVVA